MTRVKLIHWNASEVQQRAEKLRAAGYDVDDQEIDGPGALRQLQHDPPTAIVIDLSRKPSQGRDVAIALRRAKATRHIPIVFVEGDAEKVAGVQELLPDATFTTWGRIRSGVKKAIARSSTTPIVPDQMAGYSGTPLLKKLGIKQGTAVALVNPPREFGQTLGKLPPDTTLKTGRRAPCDLTIWFPKSLQDLEDQIDSVADSVSDGAVWIAWPKKASGVKTDLTQTMIRKIGLAAGLVDYKICAIDTTWSGLKFTRRKSG